MRTAIDIPAVADRPADGTRRARRALSLLAALALIAGGAVLLMGEAATRDPDFVRLMRFMAAMKGGFALAAFAACF